MALRYLTILLSLYFAAATATGNRKTRETGARLLQSNKMSFEFCSPVIRTSSAIRRFAKFFRYWTVDSAVNLQRIFYRISNHTWNLSLLHCSACPAKLKCSNFVIFKILLVVSLDVSKLRWMDLTFIALILGWKISIVKISQRYGRIWHVNGMLV